MLEDGIFYYAHFIQDIKLNKKGEVSCHKSPSKERTELGTEVLASPRGETLSVFFSAEPSLAFVLESGRMHFELYKMQKKLHQIQQLHHC